MGEVKVKHPATFSKAILERLDELVPDGVWLDPFAGTGKIEQLERPGRGFVGIEIEPEWAHVALRMHMLIGDCRKVMRDMLIEDGRRPFDGIVTSPVYGNRMSDHHNAKDASTRRSYKFDLGRDLTEGNAGMLYYWQDEYRELHLEAWNLARKLTREGGTMFLNVKNFYRTVKGEREEFRVVAGHVQMLKDTGWSVRKIVQVDTPSMRYGENHESRFESEAIIIATNGG